MSDKNYKIKLTVTDPSTDKSLSASMDLELIKDLKALNGLSALDEMLHVLTHEIENAVDTQLKIDELKNDLEKTLKIKKAFEDLDAEYPDMSPQRR